MAISDEKFVSSTTYRKTGTPVSTPTWIVDLDGGRVGFWTSSKSGKYKRLRNNPKIMLQPSDQRGKVKAGTAPVEGTVELATSGPAVRRGAEQGAREVRLHGAGVALLQHAGPHWQVVPVR
jgi:PPOX class probable F420-dependent enzyme